MPTIIDVEIESGVSKSTISRYLQGKNVTRENRIKIDKAIEKLGYKLNPLASGLKSSKTQTVGVVIPDITDSFFPPIIKEFESFMSENGYHTILSDYGNDKEREVNQLKLLEDKKVDGIIIASDHKTGEHITSCLNDKIPVVLIDRLIAGIKCDSVTVDNYQASYEATTKCLTRGHMKIGAVYGDHQTDGQRIEGFKKALTDAGIKINYNYLRKINLEKDVPEKVIRDILAMEDHPSLLFCSNIYVAKAALTVRLQDDLQIPEDISIYSFDDLASFPHQEFISQIKPEFTGIYQPLKELGRVSAQLLLERLKIGMDEYKPINIELKTEFKMTPSVKTLA